jgi:transcriptional regulator with XRE-family HTH domain
MRLGPILRKWRITHELALRDLASMMYIAPATLSRFENEKEISAKHLVIILTWVMQPAQHLVAGLPPESILEEHDDQLMIPETEPSIT